MLTARILQHNSKGTPNFDSTVQIEPALDRQRACKCVCLKTNLKHTSNVNLMSNENIFGCKTGRSLNHKILEGDSIIGVHVRSNLGCLSCSRHLFRLRAATNLKKKIII